MAASELYAALDLGSNSFHLLLARRCGDAFETVERIKEKVQLLAGFRDGQLDAAAMRRGEACLARFAQRLADVPRSRLRLVGTHALRVAANRDQFVQAAERVLGVPLEIVSGDAEARLIYLGVAHHVQAESGRVRVVLDIGGGSTEVAWGDPGAAPGQPSWAASYECGCVSLTDRFFAAGDQAVAFRQARDHALAALAGVEAMPADGQLLGTSGTIESVQTVLAANGWGADYITREGLAEVTEAIVSGRWLVEAGLPGLPPDRVDIFPAGVALLDAAFERLGANALQFVDASLQYGLLYQQIGPPAPDRDQRDHTVARLKQRYGVDAAQAARVRATSLALFDACPGWWTIEPEHWRRLLGWAAELHEAGTVVAPRHYHRHGAYLVQNADLPAFSRTDQSLLALLVRGHRRSFPGLSFRAYDGEVRRQLERLLVLLRLAVILHRSHRDADAPEVTVAARDDGLEISLPPGWLDAHPLSARELDVEVAQLAGVGIALRFR
jgi:exopolyphosphatase/guanosine-5'-triphosphate,3'-diphosphate pyrophosphatase